VGKKEFEQFFHKLRKDRSRIVVKKHAYLDYPERGFSPMEILDLCAGPGRFIDNRAASAKPGSMSGVARMMTKMELNWLF
jgi:ubiquinone/menaquinone biosynthesis C-methylase UbiE